MADKDGASWLRYGCFGCLGVILLAVLVVIGVTGLAALKARDEKVTERELTPPISASDSTATESVEIETGDTGGRVVLSLFHAEFEVLPADPGEPLRVEATYDEKSYELVERFDDNGESGWVYEVTFRRTGGQLMTELKQMFSGSRPRVAVYLPRDVKIDLDLETRQGALEGNLGGLWLGSAEIKLEQGGLQLSAKCSWGVVEQAPCQRCAAREVAPEPVERSCPSECTGWGDAPRPVAITFAHFVR